MSKRFLPYLLHKFDEKREGTPEVLVLACMYPSQDLGSGARWHDRIVEDMRHFHTIEVPGRHTTLHIHPHRVDLRPICHCVSCHCGSDDGCLIHQQVEVYLLQRCHSHQNECGDVPWEIFSPAIAISSSESAEADKAGRMMQVAAMFATYV